MTIAIIGAGMAGLSCAGRLAEAGRDVRLFDKGRGPGGRMSTRRAQTPVGELRWDHGAQYFTARDEGFRAAVDGWAARGAAAEWTGRFVSLGGEGRAEAREDKTRYVGAPAMNSAVKAMAEGLDVVWGAQAAGFSGAPGDWRIAFEAGGEDGPFDAVLVAAPAEQAAALLRPLAPAIADEAAAARSAPCWAAMLAFERGLQAAFDAARIKDGPVSWLARNASKPGRGAGEAWVAHASPDWSRAHLEDEAGTVADALAGEAARRIGAAPVFVAAHRWRFAQVETSAATPAAWDAARRVGACGDWRVGARVEAAWLSGRALAEAVLAA